MAEEEVDKKKLYADVRKLIFDDCKDTSIWDHLGNLDPVHAPADKHVQFNEKGISVVDDRLDVIQLPLGCAVLFDAATISGKTDGELYRMMLIMSAPEGPENYGCGLYRRGMERLYRLRAADEARRKRDEEEEMSHCTWKPEVSALAKEQASKKGKYYAACLEWQRITRNKLTKKHGKTAAEKMKEDMEQFTMGERSKKLAERAKKKKAARSKSVEVHGSPSVITPRQAREAKFDEDHMLTFTPITNSSKRLEFLFSANTSNKKAASCDPAEMALSFSKPEDGIDKATAVSQLQLRLNEDIENRRKRIEERAEEYKRKATEKLYDKITGQPLFEPNAMPTKALRDGTRVPFNELPKRERHEIIKNFKTHRIDFVPSIAEKHANKEKREMDDIVRSMLTKEKNSVRQKGITRRKLEQESTKECTFKPEILKKSADMVSSHSDRPKLHERLTKVQKYRIGQGSEKAADEPTPEKNKKVLGPRSLQSLIDRQMRFADERKRNYTKSLRSVEKEEQEACTFKPKLNASSIALVEASESRRRLEPEEEFLADPNNLMLRSPQIYEASQHPYMQHEGNLPMSTAASYGGSLAVGTPYSTAGALARRKYNRSSPQSQQRHQDPVPQPLTTTAEQARIHSATKETATGHSPQTAGDFEVLQNLLSSWEELNTVISKT